MKKLLTIITLVLLTMMAVPAVPALADQADPDSDPSMESVNCYRNALESGDMACIWESNIPYASIPDATVSEAFIWSLIDSSNTTLGTTVGFPYHDNGYGYNVFSLYWDSDDAPTWAGSYTLSLSGNPAVFDSPQTYLFPVSAGSYSALTIQSDVQSAIADLVITLAQDLDNRWAESWSLISETEAGTVLSLRGQTVFRGSIYGLQAFAPAAFDLVLGDVELVSRNWTDEYSDNVADQWTGTWVDTAKAAGAALFGTSYDMLTMILLGAMIIGVIMLNSWMSGNAFSGMMDGSIVLIAGTRLGMIGMGVTGLLAALCWLFTAGKLWKVW